MAEIRLRWRGQTRRSAVSRRNIVLAAASAASVPNRDDGGKKGRRAAPSGSGTRLLWRQRLRAHKDGLCSANSDRRERERDSAKLMAKNHLWAGHEEDKVMPMKLFRLGLMTSHSPMNPFSTTFCFNSSWGGVSFSTETKGSAAVRTILRIQFHKCTWIAML